ncbi:MULTISPECIES: hypothetical protein [Rhizobium/Agrobacterium group]|uniref:hypothetical protein n=1 Tax=Rhizobium/Agrobacterium group TaxID=227290 RepID=UPI0007132465|nr:hypothetical protein [Rhizobium sp. Root483D2]KQY44186.1 hypothetical protein ASD32_12630 [Rhizobium sp. Root483D2]
MCNHLTSNQQTIRDFIKITRYREGNLPPSVNVHPDRLGPIIHVDQDGERELAMSAWGMPTPEKHRDGKAVRILDEFPVVANVEKEAGYIPQGPFTHLVPAQLDAIKTVSKVLSVDAAVARMRSMG